MREVKRVSQSVLTVVKEFLSNLAREVSLREAYIFGSTARGERLSESDVDLVVVADEFEGMPLSERIRIVYRLWPLGQLSADIIPLGPGEFKRRRERSVVLRDAARYWIRVWP